MLIAVAVILLGVGLMLSLVLIGMMWVRDNQLRQHSAQVAAAVPGTLPELRARLLAGDSVLQTLVDQDASPGAIVAVQAAMHDIRQRVAELEKQP